MFPTLDIGWAAGDAGLQWCSKVSAVTGYEITPEMPFQDALKHGSTREPGAGRIKRLKGRKNMWE